MKYKLIDTDEKYVKVYPYFNNIYKPTENDLYQIQREIERHVDDIGNVEVVQEKQYCFKDEYTTYEEDSLLKLCTEMAYQRDLIDDHYYWRLEWLDKNSEKCSRQINNLEDLLDEITRHKDADIFGNLTQREKALVYMAKLLCD